MGASQTSTTNSTATQTADPRTQSAISNVLSYVPGIAATQYSSSMDPRVAALNSQQLQGIGAQGALLGNNPASPYISQANQYSQQSADPNSVLRMQSEFYNPMASAVEAQLSNQFGQQNAQMLGNAAASGSIGGSRYGVAAGNLANQQGLAAGQVLSGLQQQALSAAQQQQGQIANQAYAGPTQLDQSTV